MPKKIEFTPKVTTALSVSAAFFVSLISIFINQAIGKNKAEQFSALLNKSLAIITDLANHIPNNAKFPFSMTVQIPGYLLQFIKFLVTQNCKNEKNALFVINQQSDLQANVTITLPDPDALQTIKTALFNLPKDLIDMTEEGINLLSTDESVKYAIELFKIFLLLIAIYWLVKIATQLSQDRTRSSLHCSSFNNVFMQDNESEEDQDDKDDNIKEIRIDNENFKNSLG